MSSQCGYDFGNASANDSDEEDVVDQLNQGIIEDGDDSADEDEPAGLDSTYTKPDAANATFTMDPNATFEVDNEPTVAESRQEEGGADGLYYYESAALNPDDEDNDYLIENEHIPTRVKFSEKPILVFLTHSKELYDRRNDDVDPVSSSAEYELEKRVQKLTIFDVELEQGPEGLGISIIGMGVGADSGIEKLGIFIKSVAPGGCADRDGRLKVNDQLVEVDGNSLVGVTQTYAASAIRNTKGVVRFKIGREPDDSKDTEVARLIAQTKEMERRNQEEMMATYDNSRTYEDEDIEDEAGSTDEDFSDNEDSEHLVEMEKTLQEKLMLLNTAVELNTEYNEAIKALESQAAEKDSMLENTRLDLEKMKNDLNEAKDQLQMLDKKYNKAKRLIKEFQEREKEFIKREENYQARIVTIETEFKQEKSKVNELETKLTKVHPSSNDGASPNTNNSSLNNGYHQSHSSKYFNPVIDSPTSSPPPSSGSSKEAPRRGFDQVIASIDDRLNQSNNKDAPSVRVSSPSSPDSDLDTSAQKYRAKLKGPRHNKNKCFSPLPPVTIEARQQQSPSEIEYLHGSPLTRHPRQNRDVSLSPLLSIGSNSPGGRGDLADEDDDELKQDSICVQFRTRKILNEESGRPMSATSTVSAISSSISEGSIEVKKDRETFNYVTVTSWTADDVANWMKTVELENYAQIFLDNDVNGAKFLSLDNDRIKELGVVNKVHKAHMKRKVKELKVRHDKEKKLEEKRLKKLRKRSKSGGRKSPF